MTLDELQALAAESGFAVIRDSFESRDGSTVDVWMIVGYASDVKYGTSVDVAYRTLDGLQPPYVRLTCDLVASRIERARRERAAWV